MSGIYGQRFTSTGSRSGPEFSVNTYTLNDQLYMRNAAFTDGRLVVVWGSNGQDSSGHGVYGQIISASGTKQGGEFAVHTSTTANQYLPSVTTFNDNRFIVVWASNHRDGSTYDIFGQWFNSSGGKIGSEFLINSYTTDNQSYPSVFNWPDNRFGVVWHTNLQDGSGYGIAGQLFTSAGLADGQEFIINTYTTSTQQYPRAATFSDGRFIVTWHSLAQDGSLYGIYYRIMSSEAGRTGK